MLDCSDKRTFFASQEGGFFPILGKTGSLSFLIGKVRLDTTATFLPHFRGPAFLLWSVSDWSTSERFPYRRAPVSRSPASYDRVSP